AGLVRQLGAGIYSWLPLGRRVLRRVEAIVREEMEAIGGQEFWLPALLPAEPWKESGRWDQIGPEMFRLRDRRQADLCLGMTHEEIFTGIARAEIRSYRELPQLWFQIQPKFRDEPRPKAGVLRGRQFLMKDSYSFDLDTAGLDRAFQAHAAAYDRIFRRCGLEPIPVEASSGVMGGNESVEFMVVCEAGEDWVVTCAGCGYAANLEKAKSVSSTVEDPDDRAAPEKFATPGVRTIEALARFPGGAAAERQIKTLVYVVGGAPMLLLLRGDHELNDVKVVEATGKASVRAAHAEEIRALLGASAGSLGAVGVLRAPVFADEALRGRRGMTTGANEDDFHLRHVDVLRDIPAARFVDLRNARAEEPCVRCGKPLEVRKAIEVGHIFKLGTFYSVPLEATFLDESGSERPLVMGSYGIGPARIMAAAVEQRHDEHGIAWPRSIAPYEVAVVAIGAAGAEAVATAEQLADELEAAGVSVLFDDRDLRPGEKFADADLIGCPVRVTIGKKTLEDGRADVLVRAGRTEERVAVADLAAHVGEIL
ncbi:MAG: proline--tRNA ligase, partial [Gaiellaceae bacterium]